MSFILKTMVTPYSNLESLFTNLSFASLFLLMLSYWIQASLFSRNRYKWIPSSLMWFSLFLLTALLITRWLNSRHFPISNLYESLMFLSWGFVLSHILLELVSKNDLLGTITSPIALFTNGFAAFSLPKDMQQATALVPSLQSNWLMMHVSVMILSYVALLCGSLLSIAFLLLTSETLRSALGKERAILGGGDDLAGQREGAAYQGDQHTQYSLQFSRLVIPSSNSTQGQDHRSDLQSPDEDSVFKDIRKQPEENRQALSPLAVTLDNLSYRVLGLGFPLLTAGILSGAVWANEAWGSYWSWDPKETWALITWLVFAIYLHMRLTRGWVGKRPALIATLGFLTVWFCYLGVNLLGTGLHSYGWFQKDV